MTVQPKDHASLSDAVRIISCAKEDVKCLNVFIHSDMEHRTERVLKRYGEIKNVGIENVLPKKDKQRKTYYKYYTDQQWGNYHITM